MIKKTEKTKIGDLGEDFACKYLIENKYKILARNHRERSDEIDIIAKCYDGTLVFIEVKTMRGLLNSSFSIAPEDQLTNSKFHKISRACTRFSAKHPNLVDDKKGWRIDLIAINLAEGEKDFEIRHYENIC